MRILVDSKTMKKCDACTIERYKVPSMVLMERAALAVVEEIEQQRIDRRSCLVVCGLGNNGGDGLAIARMLFQKGSDVTVVCEMKEEKATEQTRLQYNILKQYGVRLVPEIPAETYTLVIDAIFGIGLSREIQGHWKADIETLNNMSGYKLAVDIPSGVNADNGQILGCAFQADRTVTFAYEKEGLLLYPGCTCAGITVVKDIGVDEHSFLDQPPTSFSFEKSDLNRLPERSAFSNKGTFGKVLVIAGKCNMAGAAYFSGKAAALTGCGLVKILTAEENRVILQQLLPEAILDTWSSEEPDVFWHRLRENLSWADAAVIGPGLGTETEASLLVHGVLAMADVPVVLDADALNILSKEPELLQQCSKDRGMNHPSSAGRESRPAGDGSAPVYIVTPHMGEMARLTGKTIPELKKNMVEAAEAFAAKQNVICVLKDARTVTALPEGTHYINTSGNQGMATAGAGDVLTGGIAGLIAQGMKPVEAAPFGVYLHGLAGDAMVKECGHYSMTASDILEGIRRVTRRERILNDEQL